MMILPIEMLEARYRDVPPAAPSLPPNPSDPLFNLWISPVLCGPEVIVPGMYWTGYFLRQTKC